MNTVVQIWENDGNGTPSHSFTSIGFIVAGDKSPAFILTLGRDAIKGLPCGREMAKGKRWLKILGNAYQYRKFLPMHFSKYVNGYEMDVKVALQLLCDLADSKNIIVDGDEFQLFERFKSKKLNLNDMKWTEEYAVTYEEPTENKNQLNLFDI